MYYTGNIFTYTSHNVLLEFSCCKLRIMNITAVTYYTLSSFKFGVWTPWGLHRRAETCSSSSERLFGFVCHFVHLCGFF